jgi:hypothetical protein
MPPATSTSSPAEALRFRAATRLHIQSPGTKVIHRLPDAMLPDGLPNAVQARALVREGVSQRAYLDTHRKPA